MIPALLLFALFPTPFAAGFSADGQSSGRRESSAAIAREPNSVDAESGRFSLATAMALDVLVPGGGHFYTDDYYRGTVFAGLKGIGAYAVYYYYQDYRYRRSLYHAARNANAAIDPDHQLRFRDQNGNNKTVEEFRRDSESAAQKIMFAVAGNIALYAASLVLVYFAVESGNEKNIPAFEIRYSCATIDQMRENTIAVAYTLRL